MPTRTWKYGFQEVIFDQTMGYLPFNPYVAMEIAPNTTSDTLIRFILDAQVTMKTNDTFYGGPGPDWFNQLMPMVACGIDIDPGESEYPIPIFADDFGRVTGTGTLGLNNYGPAEGVTGYHTAMWRLAQPIDSHGQRKPLAVPHTAPVGQVTIRMQELHGIELAVGVKWNMTWALWARVLWETP